MRKQTLAGVCSLLAFAIVYGFQWATHALGIHFRPFLYVAPLAVAALLVPVLMVALGELNRRLLDWRKARGRDIEEEERYENLTAGIITLRPNDPDKELHSDRWR